MPIRHQVRGLFVLALLAGAPTLRAGDGRAAILQAEPIRIAMNHAALLTNRPNLRIAFLPVNESSTCKGLIDQAIETLTKKGFNILARENIARVLDEQRVHAGELVDLDQQVQLGKIMGITDLVMVEATSASAGGSKVTYKAIDITSARILRLIKETFPDQKNAGKALSGLFVDWNETYELRLGPCPALESGEYGSLKETYQLIADGLSNADKVKLLAQVVGSHEAGSKHQYSASGSTLYSVKAWKGEPEDSPKRGAYLVYEAYVESQVGLLSLRQGKTDAALGHLEQASLKIEKSNWDTDESDQLARDILTAKRVAHRVKAERERAEEE
jgi:hypothetical protein